MTDIVSFQNIYLILIFIVPGLIIQFVRAQFLTGRTPKHSESILSHLILSLVYFAFVLPFSKLLISVEYNWTGEILLWLAILLLGPVVFGLIIGLVTQKEWIKKIGNKIGISTVHVIPSAWDWKFGRMQEQYIMVTLKNGSKIAGFCGKESFISSDPNERDLYIERIYDLDEDNTWSIDKGKSILISQGEIRAIEFWNETDEEKENDQK